MKDVKHPCINCIYFRTCGETSRTVPCEGRTIKRDQKENNRAT